MKQLTVETSRTINTSKSSVNKYEIRLNDIKDSNNQNDKNEIVILKENNI